MCVRARARACACIMAWELSKFLETSNHRNDVVSNSVGVVALVIAAKDTALWWCDPLGAMVIAVIIASAW